MKGVFTAKEFDGLENQENVNKYSDSELRQMAEAVGIKTEFGNYNFSTTVRNRSAAVTLVVSDNPELVGNLSEKQNEILKKLPKTLEKVRAYVKKAPIVCIKRTMGENTEFAPECRLFLSIHRKDCVRLPYMWGQTVSEDTKAVGAKFNLIYIPEWQEKDRQILVFPEQGITYVLGTDYFGEIKKGFLRMAMFKAKEKGMLGLHAGSKTVTAVGKDGKLKKYGMLLFGLSGTGKTTHSCHTHNLDKKGEGVEIVQDDVVFWCENCSALGTEKGFFIKTDGLDKETQPLLYSAASKKDSIFENVLVDYKGKVHFDDFTLTENGRGIIQRTDLAPRIGDSINLPPLSELDSLVILFITRRNTILPMISKLNSEQAAAAFMLGESIETSAGDPKRAGESVRVVGTNPFIVGDYSFEGNRFYNFVKKNPEKVQCFLLNTGGVGEILDVKEDGTKVQKQKAFKIGILESAAAIRGVLREDIEWQQDPYFGTLIPKSMEGVDLKKYDLKKFYSTEQINGLSEKLKNERAEYLKKFTKLDSKIAESL